MGPVKPLVGGYKGHSPMPKILGFQLLADARAQAVGLADIEGGTLVILFRMAGQKIHAGASEFRPLDGVGPVFTAKHHAQPGPIRAIVGASPRGRRRVRKYEW